MSDCQALHPDPDDSLSDEDDDDEDNQENDVYDVAAAEDSRGVAANPRGDPFANGDEPMEVMDLTDKSGQFEDAEDEH